MVKRTNPWSRSRIGRSESKSLKGSERAEEPKRLRRRNRSGKNDLGRVETFPIAPLSVARKGKEFQPIGIARAQEELRSALPELGKAEFVRLNLLLKGR